MSIQIARIIAGLEDLPKDPLERTKLLSRADGHHVQGQLAAHYEGETNEKLGQIFASALARANYDHKMLTFEMDRIERALSGTDINPILLKGATYVATKSKAADGRRVSDIDIIVSEGELEEVEHALKNAGWEDDESTDNDYDQQYYREWMHELPPLRHKTRGNVIDVHHRLLPHTARFDIDHLAMIDASILLEGRALRTFVPVDVFIHSCVHAFADGALDTPTRTCVELYFLFQDLSEIERMQLVARAKQLKATKAVGIATWFIHKVYSLRAAQEISRQLVSRYRALGLKWAIITKLEGAALTSVAKFYLYVRSHHLRMPMRLLIPHFLKKLVTWRPKSGEPPELQIPKL